MVNESFTPEFRKVGRLGAWGALTLGFLYFVLSFVRPIVVPAAENSIGDPFMLAMNILDILMGPFLIALMVAVYAFSPRKLKVYGILAIVFMALAVVLTTTVNYVMFNLACNQARAAIAPPWLEMFLPFKNPSVSISIDVMCWNWFYSLSMLAASRVFIGSSREKALRVIMTISGILPIAGLVILPFSEAISDVASLLGWGLLAMIVSFLLARLFDRAVPSEAPAAFAP